MLAVQLDNWRNRSVHADMESCSPKKLLNEPDFKKHTYGRGACALWPGQCGGPILPVGPTPSLAYGGRFRPQTTVCTVIDCNCTLSLRSPHENDSNTV